MRPLCEIVFKRRPELRYTYAKWSFHISLHFISPLPPSIPLWACGDPNGLLIQLLVTLKSLCGLGFCLALPFVIWAALIAAKNWFLSTTNCMRMYECVCGCVWACVCVSIIIRPLLTLCPMLDLVICLAETACKFSGLVFGMWHAGCGKWQTAQAACLPFKLDLCITQINKPKHTQRQRLCSLPTLGHRFASFHISLNKIDEQPQSAAQSMPKVIAQTHERKDSCETCLGFGTHLFEFHVCFAIIKPIYGFKFSIEWLTSKRVHCECTHSWRTQRGNWVGVLPLCQISRNLSSIISSIITNCASFPVK